MVSRKKISYQWKLFVPLVTGMWIALIALGVWIFHYNYRYKEDRIREQLNLVNERILNFYYNGVTDSEIRPFLEFVYDYYRDSPAFDKIRISVYQDERLRFAYGPPLQLNTSTLAEDSGLINETGLTQAQGQGLNQKDYFYYKLSNSPDGRVAVITVLPFDNQISAAVMPSITTFIVLFIVALVITIIAYLVTRHLGKNIKLLRSVAERAATDPNFIPAVDFPHDELGEINRQIVHIFNERAQAMKRQKREHAVAMHAIEDKAKVKRQMSSNINHELRTPISVIKGYLDTIVDNPDMDPDMMRNFITKAQSHANRLVSLIKDVSAITRLEDGGELISTEELNLHDLAFTLNSELEASQVLGGMAFNFDIPLDCCVKGNYNLLTAMLTNLARNAASYSKGTECNFAYVGEDDKFYKFVFRDNGLGVGEEHIPHLFERFYRVDTGRTRKAGGTGLGLPIVQSTILAHGGTITVENHPEGGLCFRFTLPKAPK